MTAQTTKAINTQGVIDAALKANDEGFNELRVVAGSLQEMLCTFSRSKEFADLEPNEKSDMVYNLNIAVKLLYSLDKHLEAPAQPTN